VEAVTGPEEMAKWESAELSKSDRPELTSAKIVVSGGEFTKNIKHS